MKKGIFATYKGKEYSAAMDKNGSVILRSNTLDDLSNGFKQYDGYNKSIACIKYVNKFEIEDYYKVSTIAVYKGFSFEVVDTKEDLISIVAIGGDYRNWLNLGMKCIDKGMYQKWIKKNEATIVEKKSGL